MNKDLYKKIKEKLNSLESELEDLKEEDKESKLKVAVSSSLGQKILGKNEEDRFAIICAFYEYMSSRDVFSFIESGDWANFFRNNLSKYLTIDRIELIFDDIIDNDNIVKTILNVCNDEVKKNFYDYAKKKNTLYLKNGDNRYKDVFSKIEDVLASQGLVKKSKEVPNYKSSKELDKRSDEITTQIARLSQEKEKIEADKVNKRDDLFGKAGAVIGVNPDKLIRKVGDQNSFAVDSIVLDQRLADKIASNGAIVATKPENVFDRIKQEALNALRLRKTKCEIKEINGMNTLILKDTDKTATSSNEYVRKFMKFLRKKKELFKQLVKPSAEVSQSLKAVFKTTNEKFISSVKDMASKAKSSYGELKDNLRETYDEKKSEAREKANQLKADITDYGIEAKEKIADKMQAAATTVKDMASKAKSSYGELKDNLRETYDEKKSEAREKANQLKADITDYGIEAKEKIADKMQAAATTVKDTASEVKSSYGELKDNLKEVYDEQKNVAKAKTDELVSRISDYGVSTREKMSDKLHKVADRIAPTNPRETVTYITTPDGQTKRLIVRAATKAGQIHSFKEEKTRKM